MKRVFKNCLFLAMILIVANTGCQKGDVVDGKGILKISGNEYLITEAGMYVGPSTIYSSYIGRTLMFYTGEKKQIMIITMSFMQEITSKTYKSNEIYSLSLFVNNDTYSYADNVVMMVNKSGNTYDIIITGKTIEKGHEFTITYKGTIHERKS
jgi:hypothetical protein